MKTTFGEFSIQQRWRIIAATFIVFVVTSSGAFFLKTSSDSRVFFSKENPQLKALDALEETYTKDENVLIAIEPRKGSIFTRKTLTAIEELTQKAWQIPYSRRVDSITNFQHTRSEGDELVVENLVQNAAGLSNKEIERIKRIALSELLLVNRLISPTGNITGINVTALNPAKESLVNVEIIQYVRKMLKDFRKRHQDLNIYLTGGITLNNAFYEASLDDAMTLAPIMFAVIVLMIGVFTRSISGTIATSLVTAASAFTAMGLAGWAGIYITDVTAGAPVIILTLAVADSIHILSTMLYEMRIGKTKHEAIIESMRLNLHPVFLTSLTTVIGFLSMNFSEVPPFRELGNIVAIGVTAAFFYSIFLLPAVMTILPVRVKAKEKNACQPCNKFGNFVVNHRKYLFRAMLAFMLILAIGLSRIELNDNFIEYFDESYAVRTDSDYIQENLTGMDILEYSPGSGEEGGISRPGYLAKVEEFASWFRQQPEVIHVSSITDVMKRLNKSMHGDDPAYYRIPENRELAAQYLLLYEMSLPFGLDLNSRINLDKSASRFTVTLKNLTTVQIRQVEERGNNWLKQNAPADMFSPGTGISVMFAHITERNIKSMLDGIAVAIILISITLIFAFRSLKMGFISLIPNLVPALMAFGFWGLAVERVNLAVSVVAAISLGIVVDDTVHFLSKYLRARREHDMNVFEAVLFSFHTVGSAIITTSVVLVAGFLVLTMSGFGINSSMGFLTAIAITFALMTDFLFLPPLLIKIEEKKNY